MGTFGEFLEKAVLNEAFGKTAWTAPDPLYFGLSAVAVSASGGEYIGNEPSTLTGYTRVQTTNTSTNFTAAATSDTRCIKFNNIAITFPIVAASSWPHISYAFVCDTSSAEGNLLCWGELTVHKDLDVGDTASFAANSFKITLD
jgi:hypothetical protein